MDYQIIFGFSLLYFIILTLFAYVLIRKNIRLSYLMTSIGALCAVVLYTLVLIAPMIPYGIYIFYSAMGLFNGSILTFFMERRFKRKGLAQMKEG
jgi:uncharacterized membrane protein YdjX (TVP38/TMEM64 family)